VFSTLPAGPVIIVTEPGAAASEPGERLRRAGATLEIVDSSPSFASDAFARLALAGVSSVIVEGGPTLHAALWDQRLVDRVQMYMTSSVVGPGGLPWWAPAEAVIARLHGVRRSTLGPDVLVEGDVHGID